MRILSFFIFVFNVNAFPRLNNFQSKSEFNGSTYSLYEFNIPDEQKIMYEILRNNDPASRPVYNSSKAVSVKFSVSLIQIYDMVLLLHLIF